MLIHIALLNIHKLSLTCLRPSIFPATLINLEGCIRATLYQHVQVIALIYLPCLWWLQQLVFQLSSGTSALLHQAGIESASYFLLDLELFLSSFGFSVAAFSFSARLACYVKLYSIYHDELNASAMGICTMVLWLDSKFVCERKI